MPDDKSGLRVLPKIYNHDEFCKVFFLELPFARVILSYILSVAILREIDLNRLELVNTTFVTIFLRVIYRVAHKSSNIYIYILLDFKSDNRRSTIAQLYDYSHNLWTRPIDTNQKSNNELTDEKLNYPNPAQLQRHKRMPFPCVIYLIFHCGESKITATTNVADIVDLPANSELRKKVINYESDVYDLNVVTDDNLPKEPCAYLFCRTLQIARSEKVNEEAFTLLDLFDNL
ncbi:MAG: Rpn family recombination-promoting nuclease/putative transposase [Planctomycetaceae bacterium]|jgi:hypothetical protein|nr:Rpn family recombination-promoting nuclease/putative transposase [Planctomycetaceae bacterium]